MLTVVSILAVLALAATAVYLPAHRHARRLDRMAADARAKAQLPSDRSSVGDLLRVLVPVTLEQQQHPEYWRGLGEGARFAGTGASDTVMRTMLDEYERDREIGEPGEVAFAIGWMRGMLAERERLLMPALTLTPMGWKIAG